MSPTLAHIRCYTINYMAYLLWKPESTDQWLNRSKFMAHNKMIWETWGAIYRVERRIQKITDYERN